MQHMNKTWNILAISSSRVGNSAYLEMAVPMIAEHLGSVRKKIAFIPFAAADGDYEGYNNKVKEGLSSLPYDIVVAAGLDAAKTIEECEGIMVGGGNTFKLLHDLYELDLVDLIKRKVDEGVPYIGWSAGANLTGLTIGTTNDMPIIEPRSFNALGFLPFQINPHYYNQVTEGFNGETRDMRLEEYLKVNPDRIVVGLPEGTALILKDGKLRYEGNKPVILFSTGSEGVVKEEMAGGSDLSERLL